MHIAQMQTHKFLGRPPVGCRCKLSSFADVDWLQQSCELCELCVCIKQRFI